jgi:putative Holliday junction resolvase
VTRFLGVDLGERRIGLALADDVNVPARPLTTISRGRSLDEDAAAIRRLVAEQRIDEVVVGLPLEAAGAEGPMARASREWAEAIGTAVGRPVTLRDERLTSHLAEQRLGPMGRGRSGGPPSKVQRDRYRARVDREAAAILLQDELDARRTRAEAP